MRRTILPVLTVLALTGCTVGGAPEPQRTAAYAPTLAPADPSAPAADASTGERGDLGDAQADRDRGRTGDAGGARPGASGATGAGGPGVGGGSGSGGTPPGSGTSTSTQASVTDPGGDASGVSTPAWADLTAATLRRDEEGWTTTLTMAAPVPDRTSGDQVLDLTLWVDRNGDGTVDDEVLAQLGEDGWTTAYRFPEGARFGADSGVEVRGDGAEVVVRMPAGHLGGVERLRWLVSAELGSLAAMAAGTATRDTAPDSGAADFPA